MFSERIERAIRLSVHAHAGQTRKADPGVPYATHPFHVALIVLRAGGDEGGAEEQLAVAAAVDFGLDLLLVGRKREIETLLLAASYRGSRIGIVEAEDVVGFDEPATAALRKKPRASVRVAAELDIRQLLRGAGGLACAVGILSRKT